MERIGAAAFARKRGAGSVEEEKEGNQTKPAVPPQMTPNDPMQGKTAGVIQIQCSGE